MMACQKLLKKIAVLFLVFVNATNLQSVKTLRHTDISSLKKAEINKVAPSNTIKDSCQECNLSNKRADYFLKRIIQTFLDELGNSDELKSSNSPLHSTIRVILSQTELETLTIFADSLEESNNYQEIDNIISSILHQTLPNNWEILITSVSLVDGIQIFLLVSIISLGIYTFITTWTHLVQYRFNSFVKTLICFQLLCILSFTWEFMHMYEESVAKVATARRSFIAQCDPARVRETNGLLGYINVQLYGYRDNCDQLYVQANKNPLWSVNPLEVFTRSCAGFVFSQLPYIGEMFGRFLNNVMLIVPNWLKPVLIGPLLLLALVGIFGFRVTTPFLSLETRGLLGIGNRREQRPLTNQNILNVAEAQQ